MDTIDLENKKWFTQTVRSMGTKARRVPILEPDWENFTVGSKVLVVKIDEPYKKKFDTKEQQKSVDTESNQSTEENQQQN